MASQSGASITSGQQTGQSEEGFMGMPRWAWYLAAAVAAGLVIAFAPASGT